MLLFQQNRCPRHHRGHCRLQNAQRGACTRQAGRGCTRSYDENATEFISPLVFETLTRRRCQVDTFDRNFQYDVAHISLANAADLMLIAPATANVIAKLAHGQADDMLTTVTLAATCPKLVAPAMNTHMLENPHHPG